MITNTEYLSLEVIALLKKLFCKTYIPKMVLLLVVELFDDELIEENLLNRYSDFLEYDSLEVYSSYDTIHDFVQCWDSCTNQSFLFVFMIDLIVFNHLASDVTYYDIWYIHQLINKYSF